MQDNMKTIYSIFIFLSFILSLNAQETTIKLSESFLFKQFVKGKILMNNKECIKTLLNYNCEDQCLYYIEGNEYKKMYDTSNIDTIYVGHRKFIPSHEEAGFWECIPAPKPILWVDRKAKFYYMGKRGAMGVVTQAGGQITMDLEYAKNKTLSNPDNSVYKMRYKNTYWTRVDGQQVSFNNLKSLLELYPETDQKAISQLAKKRSVKFSDPWQVAKLLIMYQTVKENSQGSPLNNGIIH